MRSSELAARFLVEGDDNDDDDAVIVPPRLDLRNSDENDACFRCCCLVVGSLLSPS